MQLVMKINFILLNIFHYIPTHTQSQFESIYTNRLMTGYVNRMSLEVELTKKKKRANILCNLSLFFIFLFLFNV